MLPNQARYQTSLNPGQYSPYIIHDVFEKCNHNVCPKGENCYRSKKRQRRIARENWGAEIMASEQQTNTGGKTRQIAGSWAAKTWETSEDRIATAEQAAAGPAAAADEHGADLPSAAPSETDRPVSGEGLREIFGGCGDFCERALTPGGVECSLFFLDGQSRCCKSQIQ